MRIEVSGIIHRPPEVAIAFLIHDGPVLMHGRQSIEPEGEGGSRLTISADIPGAPDPLDPMPVETSFRRITELIAAER